MVPVEVLAYLRSDKHCIYTANIRVSKLIGSEIYGTYEIAFLKMSSRCSQKPPKKDTCPLYLNIIKDASGFLNVAGLLGPEAGLGAAVSSSVIQSSIGVYCDVKYP